MIKRKRNYKVMFHHIDYKIDKKKYRDIFYTNIQRGQWHWLCPKRQELFWYQLMIPDGHDMKPLLEDVERDLNIHGMNNFPRFAYMFKGNDLQYHLDEDYMSSICINLMDGPSPEQVIEDIPTAYECMLFENGNLFHYVESRDEDSLMLKFCIRHPWEEIYERVKRVGLCD